MELLNDQQREVKADVEGVLNRAEKQMGDERRQFNAGHEERKQKVGRLWFINVMRQL